MVHHVCGNYCIAILHWSNPHNGFHKNSFASDLQREGSESKQHVRLTLMEKVKILKKNDKAMTIKSLCTVYGTGSSTNHDIIQHCDRLLKFSYKSAQTKGISERKTLKCAQSVNHDRVF